MHRILFLLLIQLIPFVFGNRVSGQQIKHDWENYIASVQGKPVSINLDLGLFPLAPIKEYPFVIIARVKVMQADVQGLPEKEESEKLLDLEDRLVELLARQNGALFAGRFTQRGIREFYFYAQDTTGYRNALNQAFLPYPDFEWLAQAKRDEKWENYFTVLYPSAQDKIRSFSRKRLEEMSTVSKQANRSISIIHFFEFPNPDARKKFLLNPLVSGYVIEYMPIEKKDPGGTFSLVISKKEKPDFPWIETTVIPLQKLAGSSGGDYKGWDYANK